MPALGSSGPPESAVSLTFPVAGGSQSAVTGHSVWNSPRFRHCWGQGVRSACDHSYCCAGQRQAECPFVRGGGKHGPYGRPGWHWWLLGTRAPDGLRWRCVHGPRRRAGASAGPQARLGTRCHFGGMQVDLSMICGGVLVGAGLLSVTGSLASPQSRCERRQLDAGASVWRASFAVPGTPAPSGCRAPSLDPSPPRAAPGSTKE